LNSDELNSLASLIPYASERELTRIERLLAGYAHPPDPPSLSEFVHATCQFKLDPWQEVLCARLQRLCYETGQRVLIHAPPQWGKSLVISQRFPTYYLGRRPTSRIKLACYNITHATRFGSVCREIAQSADYRKAFPGSPVPPKQSRGEWSTQARMDLNDGQPSFAALGLLTGFVGQGAELLVVDDPYASPQDAASEAVQESVWTFWDESARVRLTDSANVVVMFHRYSDMDLAGRLIEAEGLKRDGGRWELMRFAAVADGHGDDPMGRAVGEKLSPRMTDAYLEEQRKSGFAWDGQFQGLPGRKGGNLFEVDRLRIVDAAPANCQFCRGWDQASSPGSGDFTVGVKIGRAPDGIFYITDVIRGQWDTATRNRTIVQTAELDGRACRIAGEQEPGSGGKDQAVNFVRMLAGFSAVTLPASGSKEVRADPLSAQVNAGNVCLVRAPWNRILVEEYRAFPLGRHDDIVDGSTTSFNRLVKRPTVGGHS
jgi:predicted phage terminase large subunit-like protein